MMKTLALAALTLCLAGPISLANADDTCSAQATAKKLSGAAKTSFVKKCCDTQAADKKLSGAAKTTFTNKCVKDATSG